ncbi:MAG: pilus assembly PilX N-terminal domain-containing protein [Chromatiaceae bacterium]|nr:pilus assembly PilX N-terminal domain-containing protein [Chromatiaceae bacterium]
MTLRNVSTIRCRFPGKQDGSITLATGLIMLVMLTAVVLYTAVLSVEEKKTAANHWRAADAFARAEQGLDAGFAFYDKHKLLANADSTEDITGEGDPDLPDAWFPADGTGGHWAQCSASDVTPPCGNGDANVFPGSVAYDANFRYSGRGWVYKSVAKGAAGNPFDTADLQDEYGNLKFDLFLLAECARPDCAEAECVDGEDCRTDCASGTCSAPDGCAGAKCSFLRLDAEANYGFTVMARGYSDDDIGQAFVRSMAASRALASNESAAPIVAAGAVGISGNFTVVTNPDAIRYEDDAAEIKRRGSGVPLSVWASSNVTLGISAQTCHLSDYLKSGSPNDDAIYT